MNCEEARELFIDLSDNSLDLVERKELEKHLACCKQCQQLFESYQQLLSDLGELRSDPPFWVRFRLSNIFSQMTEDKSEPKKSGLKFLLNKWVVGIVATIIVLMNLFYFTDIFPPANRSMHTLVASTEALFYKVEGIFEQVKDSGNFIWLTIFGKTLFAENRSRSDENVNHRPQGG